MAWRPWYQPQLPHTRWGSFTEPQRGHELRDGTDNVHAAARRLWVLARDFFFLGTAMVSSCSRQRGGFADQSAGRALVARYRRRRPPLVGTSPGYYRQIAVSPPASSPGSRVVDCIGQLD